jgi:phospholipid:diacylglycerol acyltransferase
VSVHWQSLESWSTSPEYRAFFRQKVWGGFPMISQVTFNREKWMSMLLLDPVTGLDPEGVKVRASEGFDAASSFMMGYWIWQVEPSIHVISNSDSNLDTILSRQVESHREPRGSQL